MRIPSWNFHTIIFKALFGPGPIHTEVKKIPYDCGNGQHNLKNGTFTKEKNVSSSKWSEEFASVP